MRIRSSRQRVGSGTAAANTDCAPEPMLASGIIGSSACGFGSSGLKTEVGSRFRFGVYGSLLRITVAVGYPGIYGQSGTGVKGGVPGGRGTLQMSVKSPWRFAIDGTRLLKL